MFDNLYALKSFFFLNLVHKLSAKVLIEHNSFTRMTPMAWQRSTDSILYRKLQFAVHRVSDRLSKENYRVDKGIRGLMRCDRAHVSVHLIFPTNVTLAKNLFSKKNLSSGQKLLYTKNSTRKETRFNIVQSKVQLTHINLTDTSSKFQKPYPLILKTSALINRHFHKNNKKRGVC